VIFAKGTYPSWHVEKYSRYSGEQVVSNVKTMEYTGRDISNIPYRLFVVTARDGLCIKDIRDERGKTYTEVDFVPLEKLVSKEMAQAK